jgi:hypothetical protein
VGLADRVVKLIADNEVALATAATDLFKKIILKPKYFL